MDQNGTDKERLHMMRDNYIGILAWVRVTQISNELVRGQILYQDLYSFRDVSFVRFDVNFRVDRGFVRRRDTGEIC